MKDAHIIFNESKVVNARLSVNGAEDQNMEMMILDLGENLDKNSKDAELTVMLRKEGVQVGDVFTEHTKGTTKFRVVHAIGPWIEDEHSNGNGTECIVECTTEDDGTVAGLLESVGSVPIPPYLNREAEASDKTSYNNVYAAGEGSVAAPTAGLHFTEPVLAEIGPENISFLSLHVGAGTFKPVVVEDARDHDMHGENFEVHVGEIQRLITSLESGKRVVVVGTTSSRTLESLYWCGVKLLKNQKHGMAINGESMKLGQHEWRHLGAAGETTYSAAHALRAVIDGKQSNEVVQGRTSLMIAPGYEFRVVEDLITNFHAPDSTLMLLVSAFLGSGNKVRSVYEEAQNRGFKFLSYGDACFFSRQQKP